MKRITARDDIRKREDSPGGRRLSLAVRLTGLRCLVVGGGRIGTRKAVALADAGAEVTVLAPDVAERLRELARQGRLRWRRACFDTADLDGMFLVVAATSDPELNLRIGEEADARGILSCVVSSAAASRVIFPAVHVAGFATVAVHTDGRDCRRAKAIRDAIAAEYTKIES